MPCEPYYRCNKKGQFVRQCQVPKIPHTKEVVSDESDNEEVFFNLLMQLKAHKLTGSSLMYSE